MNSAVHNPNYAVEPSDQETGYVIRLKVKPMMGLKVTVKMLTNAGIRKGKGAANDHGVMIYPDKAEAVRIATRFDKYLTEELLADGA